ncbi:MAG: IS110 family transposase [Thermoanaerobaculia bacterium]
MKDSTFWVGLDWHADWVTGSVFGATGSAPLERLEVVPDARGLARLIRRLKGLGRDVRCVYEAGPCGYEPQRALTRAGIACAVAASSLIPRRPGDRVKTDRRDAEKLGRLYRAGELTLANVPDERQEALRDLVRAREDASADLLRRRHRLSKFLLRHGHRYRDGKAWTQRHGGWIRGIHFTQPYAHSVFEEYQAAIIEQLDQLARFDRLLEQAARTPELAERTAHLQALRGISIRTALTLLAEAGDLRRYAKASQFMGATGLIPSEHSSGATRRQGAITKTGNAHLRRVLVEAAWHYRHRPGPSRDLSRRRLGQTLPVLSIARKAEARLYRKYQRLTSRGKRSTQAVVAVARELAGFIWAIAQTA